MGGLLRRLRKGQCVVNAFLNRCLEEEEAEEDIQAIVKEDGWALEEMGGVEEWVGGRKKEKEEVVEVRIDKAGVFYGTYVW